MEPTKSPVIGSTSKSSSPQSSATHKWAPPKASPYAVLTGEANEKMMLPVVMQIIEQLLSEDNIRKYGDRLFDFVEDAVTSSKTTIDDVTVLPVIEALRKGLGIPDND